MCVVSHLSDCIPVPSNRSFVHVSSDQQLLRMQARHTFLQARASGPVAQAADSTSKTRMCRTWERTGTCPYAGRCRFAHGEEELRPAAVAVPSPAAAASRLLELERVLRERDAMLEQAEERARQAQRRAAALLSDAEELRRSAAERETALLRRVEEAEARALNLEWQLSRARQELGSADARSLSQALSGETSTASFAELAAATRGFAASSILGRGGFGPVYRGEWGGQAVAIKRLDPVRPPFFIGFVQYSLCVV